jgi:hypothetical protein
LNCSTSIFAGEGNRILPLGKYVVDRMLTLGRRPVKEKQSYSQNRKAKKEAAERNHIEGKFGQGKNGYALNQIRARLKETSESWLHVSSL